MKKTVVEAFKDIREKVIESGYTFICVEILNGIAYLDYPIETQTVLYNALINMDDDLWETTRAIKYSRSKKECVDDERPFWNGHDVESRVKFLDRLIKELEKP